MSPQLIERSANCHDEELLVRTLVMVRHNGGMCTTMYDMLMIIPTSNRHQLGSSLTYTAFNHKIYIFSAVEVCILVYLNGGVGAPALVQAKGLKDQPAIAQIMSSSFERLINFAPHHHSYIHALHMADQDAGS